MPVLKILLKRNRIWVFAAILAALVSNLSQMFYFVFVGKLVDKIAGRQTIEYSFIAILAVFMITNVVTVSLNHYIGHMTAEKMAHSLRMGYARKLLKKTNGENRSCDAGQIMSVVQNELAQADAYLGNTFFDIFGMTFSGILVLVFLLFQNALLTMTLLIPAILILVYVLISSKRMTPLVSETQNAKNRMNHAVYSTVHAFPAIRIFDGEKLAMHTFQRETTDWVRSATKLERRSALYNSLSGVLSGIPLLLLLLAGGYMVLDGHIMLGTLIVFLNLQKSLMGFVMNLPAWIGGFKIFTANLTRIEIE